MKSTYGILAILPFLYGFEAIAADANKPDAASITKAMYAAVGVGNVDAAVSFFADDGYNIGPSGRKTTGKNELQTLISNSWIPENVQVVIAPDAKTRGENAILHVDISTNWEENLGVAPAQQVNIVNVEGNKIKSITAYFTPSALEKLTQACDAHPDSKMPSGTPCGRAIPAFRKHTDNLITQGFAEKE
ncbi:MAG: hypothetical protein AB7T18_01745 [Alphaproteobacteria bacterium]